MVSRPVYSAARLVVSPPAPGLPGQTNTPANIIFPLPKVRLIRLLVSQTGPLSLVEDQHYCALIGPELP